MKNVTKNKHAGMLRVLFVMAAVLLLAAAGVGAASAATQLTQTTGDLDAGDYYLGGNLQLTGQLTISSGAVTIDLKGYTITAASGKRLFMIDGGTFTLNDSVGGGKLVGNGKVSPNGGCVFLTDGEFTLNGGNISGCSAGSDGGCVYLNGGMFIMNGGNISDCSAGGNGGGVHVFEGKFTMNGGSIINCSASSGDYIYNGNGDEDVTINRGLFDTAVLDDSTFCGVDDPAYKATLTNGTTTWAQYSSTSPYNLYPCPFTAPEGKSFSGWAKSQGGAVEYADKASVSGSQQLYAVWEGAGSCIVYTETELIANLTDGNIVKLGNDIQLTNKISLLSGTMTLDLNGHNLTSAQNKCSFNINGASFTLNDSVGGGCLVGNGTVGGNGGCVHINSGSFTMNGGSITGYTAGGLGGGVAVENGGTFTMSGGSITNCVANNRAGGVCVLSGGTFTMTGGSISGCSTPGVGGGVLNYGSFTMSGTAVVAENNDVFLFTGANITCSGLTGADAGAKNITLQSFPTGWLGKTIVKNGAGNKSNFALSSAYAGYELKAGTDGHENDLILAAAAAPAYIEVSDWDALVAAASEWTKTDKMRTIVVMQSVSNGTGIAGNYTGIPITGNVTIKPADTGSEIKIDANQKGRLFAVASGANLTICDNGSAALNLTGGYRSTDNGGAVSVSGGTFTMDGGNISGCSTSLVGGGVFVWYGGTFTMKGGNITGCSASGGGGVYVTGEGGGVYNTFIMEGGSITNCVANSHGGGVLVFYGGTFTMEGGNITNCTAAQFGGGVANNGGTFTMEGGSIKDNKASVGAGVISPMDITLGGDVQIGESDNDFALFSVQNNYPSITNSSFTGYVKNITLYFMDEGQNIKLNSSAWLGRAVVKDSTDTSAFKLSPLHTGYSLETSGNDLVVAAAAAPAYIEVSDWDALVAAASGWTDKDTMCTIVVMQSVSNGTGIAGNYTGIPITGNITIKPALDADEIKIDGAGYGRLFYVNEGANLTLVGNNTAVLNVTGGNMSGSTNPLKRGGAVFVSSGANLTLADGAKITGCSAKESGGGVYVSGTFTLSGGSIINCCANRFGGGVYVNTNSIFTLSSGSIIGCSATESGGGVYVSGGTFSMTGGSISGCNATTGGGVCTHVFSTFTMNGGSIIGCSATQYGGGAAYIGTSIMTGGSISGCSAVQGSGVFVYYLDDEYFGTFIMNGTAVVDAGNDVSLGGNTTDYHFITNITLGDGGFTAANAGAKNITLQDGAAAWEGKTIVKNGAGNKSNFALSSAYAGYELKAGTDGHENDLILAAASSAPKYTLPGSGTQDDPYQIITALDLYNLTQNLTFIREPGTTVYLKLMNDIEVSNITSIDTDSDAKTVTINSASNGSMIFNWSTQTFNKEDWNPGFNDSVTSFGLSSWPVIGNGSDPDGDWTYPYSINGNVSFDGNGHTIRGLFINCTNNYVGLFGYLNISASLNVTDLTLKDSFVYSKDKKYAAGLLGYVDSNSRINVSNFKLINSTIANSVGYIGGIISYTYEGMNAGLDNCAVLNCNLISFNGGYCSTVGGLIGEAKYMQLFVTDCIVDGCNIISGYYGAGGILGENYCNPAATIKNSSVLHCSIRVADSGAGGIVGYTDNPLTMINCTVNDCDVTSVSYGAGGIVGESWSETITAKDCHVFGCSVSSDGYGVGGFVGYIYNCIISDGSSVANSTIAAGGNYAGGFVGYTTIDCTIDGACSVANSTIAAGVDYAGGFVGSTKSACTIEGACSVFNTSVSVGKFYAGGFVGYTTSDCTINGACSVSNSTIAAVGANGARVGGFVGSTKSACTIEGACSVSNSTIAAVDSDAGGFVGITKSDCTIEGACSVSNTTVSAGSYVGGLVGSADSDASSISLGNCTVLYSNVSGCGDDIGGLIGKSKTPTFVTDCTVDACNITTDSYAGGFFGEVYENTDIKNSSVLRSSIRAAEYSAGGIVGYTENHLTMINCTVDDCDVTTVDSGSYASGGLVGESYAEITAEDCHVFGCSVSSDGCVGGLFGYIDVDCIISDGCSVANSTIAAGGSDVGGLVGYADSGCTIEGACSVSNTTVSAGGSDVGGLVGSAGSDAVDASSTLLRVAVTGSSNVSYAVGSNASATATLTQPCWLNETGSPADQPQIFTYVSQDAVPVIPEGAVIVSQQNGIGIPSAPKYSGGYVIPSSSESPYIEVSDWDKLVAAASGWTKTDEMRTIVLTNTTDGAYKNTTGSSNYAGIPITGNITITPASTASEIKIDANQKGRLFDVAMGANLTVCDNGTAALNLTGGYYSGNGGCVYVAGMLTMNGGSITNSSAAGTNYGGAVYVDGATFVLNNGNIAGCSARCGGGVALENNDGEFIMNGGNITNSSADYGGGVYTSTSPFTMNGGKITNCTATQNGGGVDLNGHAFFTGGSITGCSAAKGGGVYSWGCTINVYGDVNITDNTVSGGTAPSNIYIEDGGKIWLKDNFDGSIGVVYVNTAAPAAGAEFGFADSGVSGAENFFADNDETLYGSIDGTKLKWKAPDYAAEIVGGSKYTKVEYAFGNASAGQTIRLLNNSALDGEITVSKSVTLDLNGSTLTAASGKRLFTVETHKTFTLNDSVGSGKLEGNGKITGSGGGIYLKDMEGHDWSTGGILIMNGGTITNCSCSQNGGGVYAGSGAQVKMYGGTITNCSCDSEGGGLYSSGNGPIDPAFYVKGTATITDNKKGEAVNNVYLSGSFNGVYLQSNFTGRMSINCVLGAPSVDAIFGSTDGGLYIGTENFVADNNPDLFGSLDGTDLIWKALDYAAEIVGGSKYTEVRYAFSNASDGQTIRLLNSSTLNGNIQVNKNLTLDLSGYTLSTGPTYQMFSVSESGKTFTLMDSSNEKTGKLNGNGNPGVYISGSTFIMENGTIEDCAGSMGSAVFVEEGTFIMNGGNITNCTAYSDGGGAVYVKGYYADSTFIMNGGNITNSTADNGGGAVYVTETWDGGKGIFTMNGGTITDCSAGYGGAVYIPYSNVIFTMNGGCIAGCSATMGGAVYTSNNPTVTMNGGSITGCNAVNGGGVYQSNGLFTMNGGNISGCNATGNSGAVYVGNRFTMTGGNITGCKASIGAGVCVGYMSWGDNHYCGRIIMNGTAYIAADNDVYLMANTTASPKVFTNITVGQDGFAAGDYGAKNITLIESVSDWLGRTIVENGAGNESNFALSPAYTGYLLKASGNNLILAELETPAVSINLSVGEQTKEHGTYTGYVYLTPAEGETDLTGWNLTAFAFALKGDKVTLSNYEYGKDLISGWSITSNENRVSAVTSTVGGTPLTGIDKVELARFTINTSALGADETGAKISFIDEVSGMYLTLINTSTGADITIEISGERTLNKTVPNSIIKNSTAPAWLETESTIKLSDAFTVLNEIGWSITEGYTTTCTASPADSLEIVTISDEKYCLALKGTGAGNITAVLNTTDGTFIAAKDAAFTLRENATLPAENGQSIVKFDGSTYTYTGSSLINEIKKNITIENHTVCVEHPDGIPRNLTYVLRIYSAGDTVNETDPIAAGTYTFRVGISGEAGYYANTQSLNDTAYTFTIVSGAVESTVTVNNDSAKPGHFNAVTPAVITVTYTVDPAVASSLTLNSTENIGNFSNGGVLNVALAYNKTASEQQNGLTYGTNYTYAYPKLTILPGTHPVNGKTTTEFYFTGRLLGDVTGDNRVNLEDALKIAQNINVNTLSAEETFYGQIYSRDNRLSINDAVGISKLNVQLVNADYQAINKD